VSEEQTTQDVWRDVGRQFQALGESLAQAFRTAWEGESNRQHVQNMQFGLEAMVNEIGQAIKEASSSPEGQKVRQEIEKAAESAHAAGKQALQDARPHLRSALRQVSAELEKIINNLDDVEE
jgi:hypothetical protein